jgi:hypothetical protein
MCSSLVNIGSKKTYTDVQKSSKHNTSRETYNFVEKIGKQSKSTKTYNGV